MSEQPESDRPVIERRVKFKNLGRALMGSRPMAVDDCPQLLVSGRVVKVLRVPTRALVKAELALAKGIAEKDPAKRPNLNLLQGIRDVEAGRVAELTIVEVLGVREA